MRSCRSFIFRWCTCWSKGMQINAFASVTGLRTLTTYSDPSWSRKPSRCVRGSGHILLTDRLSQLWLIIAFLKFCHKTCLRRFRHVHRKSSCSNQPGLRRGNAQDMSMSLTQSTAGQRTESKSVPENCKGVS